VTLVRDSALPWLYTVAANLARSEYRSATRFGRAVRRLEVVESVADHADAVAGRIDDDRRLRAVLVEVRRLPRAEREAVELLPARRTEHGRRGRTAGSGRGEHPARISRARARLRNPNGETS